MSAVIFPYIPHKGLPCPIIKFGALGPCGWIVVDAYVDSGAFVSVFSFNEANQLGIALKTGIRQPVMIGDGKTLNVYLHEIPIQLGSHRFIAKIGFSEDLRIGFNLLGRLDFFTRFDVVFRESKHSVSFVPAKKSRRKDRPTAGGVHPIVRYARTGRIRTRRMKP